VPVRSGGSQPAPASQVPEAGAALNQAKESRSKQVRDLLLKHFVAEGLTPGDRLPSEEEIAVLGQVGRSTAREALKLLEQEGLVTVRPGRGRYLSSLGALSVERPVTRFESQSEMLRQLGYDFETVTLSVVEGKPTPKEREALRIGASESIIRVERLRTTRGEPLIYAVCTMPRWCIARSIRNVDWSESLTDLLAAEGLTPVSSSARLRAVQLPARVAEKYSLGATDAWLLISETVVTETGARILYAEDHHRGDVFAFNVLRRP